MGASTSKSQDNKVPFGKELRKQFLFHQDYRNLNHGSFGTIPSPVLEALHDYRLQSERLPDPFIRYTRPQLCDRSRAAVAELLNAPLQTVVFVPNATTGINTVLRNLIWHDDGRDVIINFSTIYGACWKTIDYIVDSNPGRVANRTIELVYPIDDADILAKFRACVEAIKAEGLRPRVCVFDTISSRPGVRFPFEALTAECRALSILSCIDGAHGVGQIPLDLSALDPDFLVSNCHKWLHSPRGCAAFYVPLRNQHLIPSTLPTSHGYVSGHQAHHLASNPKHSAFETNFDFCGTMDFSNLICVSDAVRWRREVCGGEEAIIRYGWDLNKRGAARVAELLGTSIMENDKGTMTDCMMACVELPMNIHPDGSETTQLGVYASDAPMAAEWMSNRTIEDWKTYLDIWDHGGRMWVRLSAQIYLDMDDFEFAAKALRDVCERASKGEFRQAK